MTERGVALLAVLWVLALLGTASAFGLREIRTGIAASANRAQHLRGTWAADGCLTLLRARIDRDLRTGNRESWRDPASLAPDNCEVQVAVPDNLPADVNALSFEQLRLLPGFDDDLAERVLERRRWGGRVGDFGDLTGLAAPGRRDALQAAYPDLRDRITYEPTAWDVSVLPFVTERWVSAGRRVAALERLLR